MSDTPHTFRAGDSVRHKSGEQWFIASVSPDGKLVAPAGWPEGIGEAADCTLIDAASDEYHRETLLSVLEGDYSSNRERWALENLLKLCPPDVYANHAVLTARVAEAWNVHQKAVAEFAEYEQQIREGRFLP